jgi:hypothetical protein
LCDAIGLILSLQNDVACGVAMGLWSGLVQQHPRKWLRPWCEHPRKRCHSFVGGLVCAGWFLGADVAIENVGDVFYGFELVPANVC